MSVNNLRRLLCGLALLCLVPTPERVVAAESGLMDKGHVAASVSSILEQLHYSRKRLGDDMSKQVLQNYLDALDYNRLFFTQEDVDEFQAKYGTHIDEAIHTGKMEPARDIFERFKQRVEQRIAKVKKLIAKDYKFDSTRTAFINRQKAAWPKNEAEADVIWQSRIEAELLEKKLSERPLDTPQKAIEKRYNQLLRSIREEDDEDIFRTFMSAVAQAYDPHTEYFTGSDYENFKIMMKLSLIGVGAVLKSDEGYAKVTEVVPGGPAARDGRLKVNDRIAAVAQGNGEFEDVVDMKLDKVVERIRGKKGTLVRLQVIPADATDPSKQKIIEITRDEVNLKDQEAKAELIELQSPSGVPSKIGWITLPSFYSDMEHRDSHKKSTTDDVRHLLERLNQEGIEGLVIDLRRNGGGSLEEAINLTGLFVRGPVVQAKDTNGKISISRDEESTGTLYTGPLVVLVNRLSASASEIFAAALQDYGRAVIVGDERSFGKGTVQTMIEIGKIMPLFSQGASDAGALKLTIQKFYRVKGGSTQLRGVQADLVLPSPTDNPEIGEGALKNPLDYDDVAPLKINVSESDSLFVEELKRRSDIRVGQDPEFAYIREDAEKLRQKIERNQLSLNEKERRQEIQNGKERKEHRKTERASRKPMDAIAYEITLDNVNSKELQPVSNTKKSSSQDAASEENADEEDKQAENLPDPIRDEAIRIANDLAVLARGKKTASFQSEKISPE